MASPNQDAKPSPVAGGNGDEEEAPNANAVLALVATDAAEDEVRLTGQVGQVSECRRFKWRKSTEVQVSLYSSIELPSSQLLAKIGTEATQPAVPTKRGVTVEL